MAKKDSTEPEWFTRFMNHIKTEKGQKELQEYISECNKEDDIYNHQIDRIHRYFEKNNNFQKIIENIEKRKKTSTLQFYLFLYAKKYGRECSDEEINKYATQFTTEMYYINGYIFARLDGQGSIFLFYKNELVF